jgi:hypothetical protein
MVGRAGGITTGPGYSYNETMEVKNSILLNSLYRDAFQRKLAPD